MLFGIFGLMLYNYVKDPYGYFSDESYDGGMEYMHYFKAKNVLLEDYDAFIVGGSNSGALSTDLVNYYTGYNTYSFSFNLGRYEPYYMYIKYLIENTDVKCIFLHLSNIEMYSKFVKRDTVVDRIPAIVTPNKLDDIIEPLSFLTKTPGKEVLITRKCLPNGQIDWSMQKKEYDYSPDEYVQEHVLNYYGWWCAQWMKLELEQEIIDENIQYMKDIKKMCDDANVELIVMIGANFTSNRYKFECNAYYDYLEKVVEITDVYDFSGFTEINANPYNFYDYEHYNNIVADEELHFIFGNSTLTQEFGYHLTRDNITEYLIERKRDYVDMMKEYEETGEIKYGSYDDMSNISK